MTTTKLYVDTSINVQKSRIDALDTNGIIDLINSLDATQAQDILTKTIALTSELNNEISRATAAEAILLDRVTQLEFNLDKLYRYLFNSNSSIDLSR
jgi:hypothetical protein